MLYKYPGPHKVDQDGYNYLIIDSDDPVSYDKALSEGWRKTPLEAKALTESLVSVKTKPKK